VGRDLVTMKFDQQVFESLTPQCRGKVSYQSEVDSSNDEARRGIDMGEASSGSIYIAEYQRSGRGRGGNSWVCPEGEGLLFSLVLDPDVDFSLWYRMSLAVGLAVVNVVRGYGIEATVKWPNDIYVGDKKLGGVLIERVNELLVVGVGININVEKFAEEMSHTATSMFLETDECVSREVVLSEVVDLIYKNGSMIGDDFGYIVKQVMECFYLKNERVSMLVNGLRKEGATVGINENGYLLFQEDEKAEGVVEIVQAHEIKKIKLN